MFQVFFSEYLFNVNVMVKVATQPAFNPVCCLSFPPYVLLLFSISFLFRYVTEIFSEMGARGKGA